MDDSSPIDIEERRVKVRCEVQKYMNKFSTSESVYNIYIGQNSNFVNYIIGQNSNLILHVYNMYSMWHIHRTYDVITLGFPLLPKL